MAFDASTLDAPFAALATYDWGADAGPFAVIDTAVIAAHADAALRAELEQRLGAILGDGTSRAAKAYACRKLMMIGTAASVPALAALLGDPEHSHMARFALERIDAAEAGDALHHALGTVQGNLRLGMISSLANRRDTTSVPALAKLLAGDESLASAAAEALGTIGTLEALVALAAMDPMAAGGLGRAVVDARLACAERLLAAGKRAEAQAAYRSLAEAAHGKPAAKHVELAATRGILACFDASTATR